MMKLLRLCTLLLLILSFSPVCYAQFDFTGGDDASAPAPDPWTLFPLSKSTKVTLDFRNASVDAVIETLSRASGIPIVKDPALTGGISLESPRPVSLDDAFAMFNAELNLKQADLTKSGNFLLITVRQQSRGGGGGFNPGGGGNRGGNFGSAQTSVLQVYVLKYADATNLATTINNLYAATSNNNNTQTNPFVAAITGGGNGGGFGGGGGGGRGGRGGGNGVTGDTVKASADEFSNSLIINAPQRDQDEIASIIEQVDRPSSQPQTSEVFRLTYALAENVLPVVQNMLSNTQSLGRGSSASTTANQNRGGGGGGFGGFGGFGGNRGGSQANANGSVSADTTSNSIVVTTTQALLGQIATVIQQLDQPAKYESSTFVYVMKNARCDIVANLFNEAVGNRTTNGPVGGSLSNQLSQTSTTSSSSGGAPPSLGSSTSRSGTSTTNSTVTSNTNSTPETNGLGLEGDIVNVRNLTGNVLMIPMIDTNSIIVVAPPEDQPLVMSLLEQMDQIPQQVMINVLVVEVNLDKSDQFGIEYSTPSNHGLFSQIFGLGSTYNAPNGTVGAVATPGTSEGLVYTLSSGQYNLFLQAAATDTKLDVLSTPRIFTTNNATAQINVSTSIPYETASSSTLGTVENSFDFLDVGLVLTVTPRIMSSGYVTMDISQTDNSIQAFLDGGTEPEVNQRQAETTVSVMDGRTICLGGIIQDTKNSTVNKVPILGDIPVLGNLFKSTNASDSKDELLVFLTPHVINTPADAEVDKDENESEFGAEAKNMIPKAPPAPKGADLTVPPSSQTTVTVTPNIDQPGNSTTTVVPPVGAGAPVPLPSDGTAAPAPVTQSPTAIPGTTTTVLPTTTPSAN